MAIGAGLAAWLGGIVGSVVPVGGTLVGAALGGWSGDKLAGALYDAIFEKKEPKEDKKEEKGFLRRTADYAYDAMNQYGLCYFLSSRLVGVVIVFSIYELVLFGFDVTSMMEYLGLDGNVGDVLGTWAGAVVLSSSFYPISIYGTSHLAPYVGKKRAKRKM